MVAIVEILTENEIADLMVGNMRTQQTWNGITATFQGNAWTVNSMTDAARQAHPSVRVNQPLPRPLRGNFINLARASVNLPLVNFDVRGNVVGDIVNSRTGTPRPQGDLDLRADPNDRPGAPRPQGGQYPRVPMAEITDINDSRLVGSDELTPQQRRDLRNNGRVVIGQLTYMPDDIAEADRRFTRYLNTTRQTSLARMSGERSVQDQARDNLRVLSNRQIAARAIRRTLIPVVFSPAANIASIYVLREMLSRKQQEILDNPNYTAEMYDEDVQRVMGGWWLLTMMPIMGSIVKGGTRLSVAAWDRMTGRVKESIDRANGTPLPPRGGGPRRWARYGVKWLWDWMRTEATSAAIVVMLGRWPWMQEQYLWFLSLAYVEDVVKLTGVTGDALETIIRRGFPDAWGGSDTFDNLKNFLQDELNLDIDAPLDIAGADGNPNASQPVKPAAQNDVVTPDEIFDN